MCDCRSDVCSSDLTGGLSQFLIRPHVYSRIGQPDSCTFGTRGKNLVPRSNPAILRFCCSNKANQFAVSVLWECLIRHPPIADEVEYKLIIPALRSEDHTSELQSLMRISYAVL